MKLSPWKWCIIHTNESEIAKISEVKILFEKYIIITLKWIIWFNCSFTRVSRQNTEQNLLLEQKMTEFSVEHKTQQSKYLSSNRQRKVHKIFKNNLF